MKVYRLRWKNFNPTQFAFFGDVYSYFSRLNAAEKYNFAIKYSKCLVPDN